MKQQQIQSNDKIDKNIGFFWEEENGKSFSDGGKNKSQEKNRVKWGYEEEEEEGEISIVEREKEYYIYREKGEGRERKEEGLEGMMNARRAYH